MSSQVESAADRLQALGAFDKSAVDAAELSGQEIARVLVRLGLGAPELAVKLTNGACAANYRCVLTYPVDGICYTALSLRETSNAALGPKLKNPAFPLKR